MKKTTVLFTFVLVALMASSCSAIAGIFKAGMGVGIFIVLLVIIVIGVLIMRGNKK